MRETPAEIFACGPYSIDTNERILRFENVPVALAPKVVDTLLAFFRNPGRVLPKAELMESVWPNDFVDEANLTQNIYLLRKMFERHGTDVRLENVPKRGYRLVSSAPPAPVPPRALLETPPGVEPPPPFAVRLRSAGIAARGAVTVAAALVVLVALSRSSRPPRATVPYELQPAALEQYLLGEHYLRAGTRTGARRSAPYFKAVVREAPTSALGYAKLAESYTSLTFFTVDVAERIRLSTRAIALARAAVATDDGCAEAYAALGATQTSLERNDSAARAAFERALRLDPNDMSALLWYGGVLMNRGRAAQARTLFRRALALDAAVPGAIASLAWADFSLRDYQEAAAFSKQLLRARRFSSLARMTLAGADVALRDFADALPQIRELERDAGMRTQAVALRSQIDALQGRRAGALASLERLETQTNPESFGSWDLLALAAAYASAGRADLAFVWLERVPSPERAQLVSDPRFDRLRNDRRLRAWLGD